MFSGNSSYGHYVFEINCALRFVIFVSASVCVMRCKTYGEPTLQDVYNGGRIIRIVYHLRVVRVYLGIMSHVIRPVWCGIDVRCHQQLYTYCTRNVKFRFVSRSKRLLTLSIFISSDSFERKHNACCARNTRFLIVHCFQCRN